MQMLRRLFVGELRHVFDRIAQHDLPQIGPGGRGSTPVRLGQFGDHRRDPRHHLIGQRFVSGGKPNR